MKRKGKEEEGKEEREEGGEEGRGGENVPFLCFVLCRFSFDSLWVVSVHTDKGGSLLGVLIQILSGFF